MEPARTTKPLHHSVHYPAISARTEEISGLVQEEPLLLRPEKQAAWRALAITTEEGLGWFSLLEKLGEGINPSNLSFQTAGRERNGGQLLTGPQLSFQADFYKGNP